MSCIAVDIVAHELARAEQMAKRLNDIQPIQNQAREHHWWCYIFLKKLRRQSFSDEVSSVTHTCRKCSALVLAHNFYMSKAWIQLEGIKATCKDFEEAGPASSDGTTCQALDVEHYFTALESLIEELEDLRGKGVVIGEEVTNHKALQQRIAVDQVRLFLSDLGRVTRREVEEEACCPICLNPYFESLGPEDEVVRLLCNVNHAFHLNCISPWFHRKNICPFDRSVAFPSIMDELR